jgi:hypothetical protein
MVESRNGGEKKCLKTMFDKRIDLTIFEKERKLR